MKVRKFVYSASSSAYGPTENLPSKESDLPNPISPYACSKVYAHYLVKCYRTGYNLFLVKYQKLLLQFVLFFV